MSFLHLWIFVLLVFLLLLSPVVHFLWSGWRQRRSDFFDNFTEDAIKSYFHAFHPIVGADAQGLKEQFEKYYKAQFGRSRFFWPMLLFAGISGLLICWCAHSIPDLLRLQQITPGRLPTTALLAVAGSVMWVLYDEIKRWYALDITPADIYWWCFRVTIAVPLGYSVLGILNEKVGPAIAFIINALPTGEIFSWVRRVANKQIGTPTSDGDRISELQDLKGVDANAAEQFAAEGITTVLQLAYCDPIRVTIRTGFSYSYIVDCISQALLWIYVEDAVNKLRASGLRSAYEVLDLYLELEDPDPAVKANADQVLREAASAIGVPETSLRNVLRQVALDPYTVFLYLSWSGTRTTELPDAQRKLLENL